MINLNCGCSKRNSSDYTGFALNILKLIYNITC